MCKPVVSLLAAAAAASNHHEHEQMKTTTGDLEPHPTPEALDTDQLMIQDKLVPPPPEERRAPTTTTASLLSAKLAQFARQAKLPEFAALQKLPESSSAALVAGLGLVGTAAVGAYFLWPAAAGAGVAAATGGATMKAPGAAGFLISRAAFVANPQLYFQIFRTAGAAAAAAAFAL